MTRVPGKTIVEILDELELVVGSGNHGHPRQRSNLLSFQLRVAARYHAKAISEIVNKWEYEY